MEIKILATTGRARGEAVQVRTPKFFIGHHDNCQLRPDIPGLAGIHALIEQREGGLHLRDFGADGGTGINDRVLHARETEVFDGDLIQIGPMVLTLSVQARQEGSRGHHSAPDGWPFLDAPGEPAEPHARRVDVAEPIPPRPAERPREPAPAPAFAPAHPPEPARAAPRPEPAVLAATAAVAAPEAPAARPLPIPYRASHNTSIACQMVGDVLVAKVLATELNEEASVSPVRYELRNLLDGDAPSRMVIDLGNTRYLSSRAVGVILAHYQALERQGGVVRVCGVSKEIKPVLDQMRLSMLVDLYPTVAEAVEDPWD